jgi:hypothetical protein
VFNEDGTPLPDHDPLESLVFCASDALLSERERLDMCAMAQVLVELGAATGRARTLFVTRYGPLNRWLDRDVGAFTRMAEILNNSLLSQQELCSFY